MQQRLVSIIAFACVFTACTSSKIKHYQFNQKTAAPQLQRDVVLLKKILEANHPSLYWYTPKDTIDAAFSAAINAITDSLDEVAFRNKVATIISQIKCGHTSVRFSANYSKAIEQHRYPCFPLSIKTWGDSMVVLGSFFPRDSTFKRGTIITAINGRNTHQLMANMFPLISTDGNSNGFKSQVISSNFPNWYKLAFGVDSTYRVDYINEKGEAKTVTVKNFWPTRKVTTTKDTSLKKAVTTTPSAKQPSKHQQRQAQLFAKRSLTIDTTNSTALLHVGTFSDRLKPFFRKSMKSITLSGVKNIIIDVRDNTGGKLENSTFLTKYFIDKPFKTGDTVAAITNNIHYKKYIPQSYFLWLPMHLFSKKKADGRYHKQIEERKISRPAIKYHFNGNIYLLQGGLSFSAATLFTSNLKGQQNVTIVGEESGGGYYGNTAMFLPTVILPNSKLRIILPLYRLVIDSNRHQDGRGVLPDILVLPNSNAIKQGKDVKIDTVKALLLKKHS
ncbi:S41 family peptidase [Parasediminibacterium paludis]|uniref:S41 family peptidase n=1 Tax=Parasediminibacterium paludis TaxID=908966 RepID=A0ABV8PY38_9BACT